MLVVVKEKGVKLAGKWCYKGEKAEVEEKEYQANKNYVDIVEDAELSKLPEVPDNNKEELQNLRNKAKELGIRNAHLMGIDKLEKAIAEAEK